ncbi:MAG: zinc-ribbon and DUF3426 domain-containing protein [Pseudomonadales bacterium]|nr:zinc-ribbon and DUF3426 domain-containing protein [Pseudomonadales bacterium]
MTEQLLTKCPHCGTTFRLSPTQLESAKGAVRCGACLQVFHASDYLVDSGETANQTELDDNKPYTSPGMDTGSFSTSAETDSQSFSFDATENDDEPDLYGHSELEVKGAGIEEADEAWAEALLKELNEEESDASLGQPIDELESVEKPADPAPDFSQLQSIDNASQLDQSHSKSEFVSEDHASEPKLPFDFSGSLPEPTRNLGGTGEEHTEDIDDPSAQFSEGSGKATLDNEELTDTFKELESFDTDTSFQNPFTDELISNQTVPAKLEGADESWAQSMLSDLEDEEQVIDHHSLELEEQKTDDPGLFGLGYQTDEASDEIKHQAQASVRSKLDDDISSFFDDAENDESDYNEFASNESTFTEQANADSKSPLFTDNDLIPQALPNGNSALDNFDDDPADDELPNLLTDHDKNDSVQDYLSKFETEPIDRTAPESRSKRGTLRSIGLVALNIAALSLLAAQYTFYNFDTLARQDNLRPYFHHVCEAGFCELPKRFDSNKIKGANLIVRQHPTQVNALVVDAIIYNRANFEQAFPTLQLSFSDLDGVLVAQRDFLPSEYRQGELLSIQAMPSNTPIHLSLEIVDPGPKAVNYRLKFHYLKQQKSKS